MASGLAAACHHNRDPRVSRILCRFRIGYRPTRACGKMPLVSTPRKPGIENLVGQRCPYPGCDSGHSRFDSSELADHLATVHPHDVERDGEANRMR